ncbi:uncharacterized protein LOC132197425 [Neocloeon triangulifer]|uniref:uncharacterized protein LOC132197425 n=1 Tax=Neocloeon triangulifer TaxID=2078957 RepID=UPI00286F93FF|nr:uncharacterized protein LOC132197425 [Neocloeon triangulifer]
MKCLQKMHRTLVLVISAVIYICHGIEINPECSQLGQFLTLTNLETGVYALRNDSLFNWNNAESFCRSHNLTLITLNSDTEFRVVWPYLNANFWTSASYDQTSEGFFWGTGESLPLSSSFWADQEPNDYLIAGRNACVFGANLQLSDEDCRKPNGFSCELPEYCYI